MEWGGGTMFYKVMIIIEIYPRNRGGVARRMSMGEKIKNGLDSRTLRRLTFRNYEANRNNTSYLESSCLDIRSNRFHGCCMFHGAP